MNTLEKYEELLVAMWSARETYLEQDQLHPVHGTMTAHLPASRSLASFVNELPEASRNLLDRITCLGALGRVRNGNIRDICKGAVVDQFRAGVQQALEEGWDLTVLQS